MSGRDKEHSVLLEIWGIKGSVVLADSNVAYGELNGETGLPLKERFSTDGTLIFFCLIFM